VRHGSIHTQPRRDHSLPHQTIRVNPVQNQSGLMASEDFFMMTRFGHGRTQPGRLLGIRVDVVRLATLPLARPPSRSRNAGLFLFSISPLHLPIFLNAPMDLIMGPKDTTHEGLVTMPVVAINEFAVSSYPASLAFLNVSWVEDIWPWVFWTSSVCIFFSLGRVSAWMDTQ
jgi:hypothetical protein